LIRDEVVDETVEQAFFTLQSGKGAGNFAGFMTGS